MRIAQAWGGQRLDHALAEVLPELSLRGRRRLIASGRVLLDGRPTVAGARLRLGQELTILDASLETGGHAVPRVLAVQDGFAFLDKPAGLHSETLAGGSGPSLEALLPGLLERDGAELVNRLDQPTSGIVVASLNPDTARRYRELEDAGRVRKLYLAVASGHLKGTMTLDAALDQARRKRTRVLDEPGEPLRTTEIKPLAYDPARDATLCLATIRKGARHQIRAHLAHAGHPLLGDELYGGPVDQDFCLHHARLELDGIIITCRPDWPEWAAALDGLNLWN